MWLHPTQEGMARDRFRERGLKGPRNSVYLLQEGACGKRTRRVPLPRHTTYTKPQPLAGVLALSHPSVGKGHAMLWDKDHRRPQVWPGLMPTPGRGGGGHTRTEPGVGAWSLTALSVAATAAAIRHSGGRRGARGHPSLPRPGVTRVQPLQQDS